MLEDLTMNVSSLMQRDVARVRATDSLAHPAELLRDRDRGRRLPVVDAGGALVGIVALDYVAREACRDADLLAPPVSCETVGRTLGEICRPRLIVGDEPAVQR